MKPRVKYNLQKNKIEGHIPLNCLYKFKIIPFSKHHTRQIAKDTINSIRDTQ